MNIPSNPPQPNTPSADLATQQWVSTYYATKSSGNILYHKTKPQQVVNTTVETDLLNGEVVVGAGVMGTGALLRLTALGDWLNNSAANRITPRFKVKLGSTTLIDTATIATNWAFNASRMGWRACIEIQNQGVATSQWASLLMDMSGFFTGAGAATFTTGEGINQIITANLAQIVGGNSGAVDTTIPQNLAFTVTNPFASANLDVTLKSALVEIL